MKRLSIALILFIPFLVQCSSSDSTDRIPDRSSPDYQKAVQNFRVSLAASETDESRFAFDKMNEIVSDYPMEASAWANLGVMAMRQGNMTLSLDRFERALTLEPGNPDILAMAADARSRFGEPVKAIEYYESALSLLPRSPEGSPEDSFVQIPETHLRFALYQEYQRVDPVAYQTQIQAQLTALENELPENIPLALETIRFAVTVSDTGLLSKALERFMGLLETDAFSQWSWDTPEIVETLAAQLEQIRSRAEAGEIQRAVLPLTLLRTSLEPRPEFQQQLLELQFPVNQVGNLLRHFLWLPQIETTVLPPDLNLQFELAVTSQTPSEAVYVPVTLLETAPPFLIAVTPREVQIDSALALLLPTGEGNTGALLHPSRQIVQIDPFLDFRNSLAVAGPNGFRFYRHVEQESFEDYTSQMKLPIKEINRPFHGLWLADVDLDGDLDLILSPIGDSPKWIRNHSDGTFGWAGNLNLTSISVSGSISDNRPPSASKDNSELRDVIQIRVADLDGGSDPELIFLEQTGQVTIYRNNRGGVYQQISLHDVSASLSDIVDIVVMDHDHDGQFEIMALRNDGGLLKLIPQNKATTFRIEEFSTRADLQELIGQSTDLFRNISLYTADLDNNGALDLVLSGTRASQLLLTNSSLEFTLSHLVQDRITGLFDSDGDDRIDLVGLNGVWKNSSVTPYNGTSIRIRAASAEGDRRINSFGILGNVEVVTGPFYMRRAITEPIVHIGLGDQNRTEMLRILWPNGSVQTEFADLGLGSTIFNEQILKGSCPWLFTFNGEEMQFVTDVIWRSPLGLRINAMETAGVIQTLDRVRIAPDQLASSEGLYQLRVTAELWETHFFDHVALHAIDHPQGTMVSIDERFVFPAPDLSPVLHTLPKPAGRVFAEADARDITREVAYRDDDHTQPFKKGVVQGVAQPHSIIIELDEPATDQTLLLLSGWLYPTDSSLNLLLSQSSFQRPTGLYVEVSSDEVSSEETNWIPLFEDFGTPAGKDKTILLPLSSTQAQGIRRVRLTTTSEIFWDAIQRAEILSGNIVEKVLPVQRKELVYRGFSEWLQDLPENPLRPDYQTISGTTARWSDLEGYYTRFGDVAELLESVDDRYVIMNAGDELQLDFNALPQPEKEMIRTFVFVSDGWVKDGDFNTQASRTVGPLPYHGMSDIQYPKEENLQDSPVFQRHTEDWHVYHTRYISNQIFPDAIFGLTPDSGNERE